MREQHGPIKEQQVTGGLKVQQFGNYDLVRRIDVGGMGEVYLARQRTAFGREVAVKIIRSDLVHDITARKRFLREAEVSAYVKHEHILPLVEFGEEQGRLFLVTPYIKGGTLGTRLQRGALALDEVHLLFRALVQAVAYLHRRGVIHRDLKPSNILLDREDDSGQIYVRLIDFGIASLQGSSASPPLTTAGNEMGTLAYMAPERANGIAAPSNDIYSLGVILYQMLTGRLSTTGKLDAPMCAAMKKVVQRATAANPDERFASADELLKGFEQAYLVAKTEPPVQAEPIVQPKPIIRPEQVVEPKPIVQPKTPVSEKSVQARRTGQFVRVTKPTEHASSKTNMPDLPVKHEEIDLSDEDLSPLGLPLQPLQKEAFEPLDDMTPTPRRLNVSRPLRNTGSHARVSVKAPEPEAEVKQEDLIIAAPPGQGRAFKVEDYNAPTTVLGPSAKVKRLADEAEISGKIKPKRIPKKPGGFVVVGVSLGIVALLFAMGGLGFLAFQASIKADITVTPQVRSVSKVFTITARPDLQMTDPGTASIPITVLNSSQQASQQGKTSGVQGCTFIFNCQRSVSVLDQAFLAVQLEPSVRTKIQQDLQKQAQAAGATIVGNISYTNDNVTSNPPVDSPSSTVTVTVSEQGSVEAVKAQDVRAMAQMLLKQQIGQDYELIDGLTQVGQPVIQGGMDANGAIKIAVAAGGVERYLVSDALRATIQNHIKGMTVNAAKGYLMTLPNLDPKSVNVHVSYGDTIPNNAQQININTVTPTTLPGVQLPAVPAGTPLNSNGAATQ
jgi:serine/threonine protein kinase